MMGRLHQQPTPRLPSRPSPVAQLSLDDLDISRDGSGFAISLDDPLLRAEEIARLLAVKPSWVYDKVRAGELPCLHVGRHLRFTRRMIETWLADQR
jgi:excisionase family DNA binding protein